LNAKWNEKQFYNLNAKWNKKQFYNFISASICKEKNDKENDEKENKEAKNYIEQNDTYYETPKRSITTNLRLLSEHDCVSNNDIDDNISEISDSESNEACEFIYHLQDPHL